MKSRKVPTAVQLGAGLVTGIALTIWLHGTGAAASDLLTAQIRIDDIEHGMSGPPEQTVRDLAIDINTLSASILGKRALQIDTGSAPNSASGDPLWLAMVKIRDNLLLIEKQRAPPSDPVPYSSDEALIISKCFNAWFHQPVEYLECVRRQGGIRP